MLLSFWNNVLLLSPISSKLYEFKCVTRRGRSLSSEGLSFTSSMHFPKLVKQLNSQTLRNPFKYLKQSQREHAAGGQQWLLAPQSSQQVPDSTWEEVYTTLMTSLCRFYQKEAWYFHNWDFKIVKTKRASQLALVVKNPLAKQETWIRSLGWEDALEEGIATHYSILAWRMPWTEEPGRLQSMGLQRVRRD